MTDGAKHNKTEKTERSLVSGLVDLRKVMGGDTLVQLLITENQISILAAELACRVSILSAYETEDTDDHPTKRPFGKLRPHTAHYSAEYIG